MAPKNNRNDSKGLSYVAATPSFLKNFGQPPPSRAGESSNSGGRADLPSRPEDGKWAGGSDGEEEEDEWDAKYGGGGDDEGPQVVVLKEGRHMTAEEVKKERRRGEPFCISIISAQSMMLIHIATGKRSQSPKPLSEIVAGMGKKDEKDNPPIPYTTSTTVKKPIIPKANISKRKLVGIAAEEDDKDNRKGVSGKKKKKAKGMLSFTEVDGDE